MSETILKKKRKQKIDDKGRLGMTKISNRGKRMTIIIYTELLIYGHGIIDSGNTYDEKGKLLKSYTAWHGMLSRSLSEYEKSRHPTYKDVTCCKEWLHYSTFKKWFDINYYEIEGQKMDLDKDILFKDNKIYSPETCVFVPRRINTMFMKHSAKRGVYPIGVYFNKTRNNYTARCLCEYDKFLGSFATSEKAFNVYKEYKEKRIKEVADEYKNRIPLKLYEAMYNYIVEITD